MKKAILHIFLLTLSLIFYTNQARAQDTFYHLDSIQKIEIFFSQPDWNHQLHILKITTEGYLKADSVRVNGITFSNVGVKYKGNSSYDSSVVKNPFHIALDKYQSQNYQGVTEIKLSNFYKDPSMIREVLAYRVLNNYMVSSRCNFAKVWVNGRQFGLYSNPEDVSKGFCAKKFNSIKSNPFFKCNPTVTPAPGIKSNLRYQGSDSTQYGTYYEMKSATGWSSFLEVCSTATNLGSALAQKLDMDRMLWMLAFNIVTDNLDSYTGVFAQNYYLFKDNNGFFNPVVWDLNMAFGGFPFLGSSNNSMGSLTISNLKQLPLNVHQTDPYWPVINAVQSNPRWKKMYHAHVKTMVNELFTNGLYETWANQMRSLVDTAVASDSNKFYSYSQFQNSLTTDISVGSYQAPGIKTLMDARANYLIGRPEIIAGQPVISEISGLFNSQTGTATISAHLANHNDSAVYLGWRQNPTQKFTKTKMFDDGAHGDGLAGDGVYGAFFQADAIQSQFYIYAENDNAGIFSPERAEFEFHLLATFTTSPHLIESNFTGIALFPNPCLDAFMVNIQRCEPIEILDGLGRMIWSGRVGGNQSISTTSFKPGVYIVKIGSQQKKLIKME